MKNEIANEYTLEAVASKLEEFYIEGIKNLKIIQNPLLLKYIHTTTDNLNIFLNRLRFLEDFGYNGIITYSLIDEEIKVDNFEYLKICKALRENQNEISNLVAVCKIYYRQFIEREKIEGSIEVLIVPPFIFSQLRLEKTLFTKSNPLENMGFDFDGDIMTIQNKVRS